MKIDAFHQIQPDTVYRGVNQVSWKEVLDLYSGCHVPVSKMNQFHGSVSLLAKELSSLHVMIRWFYL